MAPGAPFKDAQRLEWGLSSQLRLIPALRENLRLLWLFAQAFSVPQCLSVSVVASALDFRRASENLVQQHARVLLRNVQQLERGLARFADSLLPAPVSYTHLTLPTILRV